MQLRLLTCWTATLAFLGIVLMSGGFFVESQFARTSLHLLGVASLIGSLCKNRQLISELKQSGGEE